MDEVLKPALAERQAQSLYRQRRTIDGPQDTNLLLDGKEILNFCSNDYLGLANHPDVIAALKKGADEYGVGAGASHLINGHSRAHHALEEELADFLGRPRALLFSTGYMANLGIITSLVGKGDTILEDRINHASLIDAGLSVQRIRKSITSLTNFLPSCTAPLTELSLVVTGDVILVLHRETAFEALTGQEWIYPVAELAREAERSRGIHEPEQSQLFADMDGDLNTTDDAMRAINE